MAIQTTRIYIVVLTTGIVVIAFYSSLTDYKRSIEVSNPSRAIFEHLHSLYLLTLTCACTQLAMPQKQILNVMPPRFHQVTQYYTSYVCKIEQIEYRISQWKCHWHSSIFSSVGEFILHVIHLPINFNCYRYVLVNSCNLCG